METVLGLPLETSQAHVKLILHIPSPFHSQLLPSERDVGCLNKPSLLASTCYKQTDDTLQIDSNSLILCILQGNK